MQAQYNRAPLTEAAIEFRLREELSTSELELVRRRFARLRWKVEELREFTFVIGGPTSPPVLVAYKFTSEEGTDVIQVSKQSLSYSRLPPYPGWEGYLDLAFGHYNLWRKEVGRRMLGRIGVRYINRFDIPCAPSEIVKIQDYLAFSSREPEILNLPVRQYLVQVNSGIVEDGLLVNMTSQSVPSPLIDHCSVTLDIDVARENVDVPQSDDDIRTLLDLIRRRRTEIFEQCLTEATRALIS